MRAGAEPGTHHSESTVQQIHVLDNWQVPGGGATRTLLGSAGEANAAPGVPGQ